MMDSHKEIKLLDLISESQAIKTTLDDANTIDRSQVEIQAINKPNIPYSKPISPRRTAVSPAPCPICGGPQWKRDCTSFRLKGKSEFHKAREPRYFSGRQKVIGNVNNSDIKRYIEVLINNQPIQLRLDTGAEATLISRSTWMAIGQPHLTAATTNLCTANGQTLDTDGTFQTSFAVRNKAGRLYKGRGVVYVTETNDLMGMPWIDQLPDFKELFKNYSNDG